MQVACALRSLPVSANVATWRYRVTNLNPPPFSLRGSSRWPDGPCSSAPGGCINLVLRTHTVSIPYYPHPLLSCFGRPNPLSQFPPCLFFSAVSQTPPSIPRLHSAPSAVILIIAVGKALTSRENSATPLPFRRLRVYRSRRESPSRAGRARLFHHPQSRSPRPLPLTAI